MAKRFTSTEIWKEDWFLELPNEYKLFWFYILSCCDQAGLFKINVKHFSIVIGAEIDSEIAFELINKGKERLRKVNGSMWLIEDFFRFQYGQNLNLNSRVHKSIEGLYSKHGVTLTSIRGLNEVKERLKDKDKDNR
jgi:hypothetical protein